MIVQLDRTQIHVVQITLHVTESSHPLPPRYNREHTAGTSSHHTARFDGRHLPSGLSIQRAFYELRLRAADRTVSCVS